MEKIKLIWNRIINKIKQLGLNISFSGSLLILIVISKISCNFIRSISCIIKTKNE